MTFGIVILLLLIHLKPLSHVTLWVTLDIAIIRDPIEVFLSIKTSYLFKILYIN